MRARQVGFWRDEGVVRGRVRHDAGGFPGRSSPSGRNGVLLVAHEKECLVRYNNIQDTLNKHHERFDKLESKAENGFERIEKLMMWGGTAVIGVISLLLTILEFMR